MIDLPHRKDTLVMAPVSSHTASPSSLKPGQEQIFDNLPDLASVEEVCSALGYSKWTIYAWKKSPAKYHPPKNLFHKFKGRLWIRTKVLKQWFDGRKIAL